MDLISRLDAQHLAVYRAMPDDLLAGLTVDIPATRAAVGGAGRRRRRTAGSRRSHDRGSGGAGTRGGTRRHHAPLSPRRRPAARARPVLDPRWRPRDGQHRHERRLLRGDRRRAGHRGGFGRVPPGARASLPRAARGLLRRAHLVRRRRPGVRRRRVQHRHRGRQRRWLPRRRPRPAGPRSGRGADHVPAPRLPDARRPQHHAEQPGHGRSEGVEPRRQHRRLERLPVRASGRRRHPSLRGAGPSHRPGRPTAGLHQRRRPRPVRRRGHRLRPGAHAGRRAGRAARVPGRLPRLEPVRVALGAVGGAGLSTRRRR